MKRCLAALLALSCASVAVSSACIAAQYEQHDRLVSYGDLDLSTPNGMAALHRRLEQAINLVCANPTGPSPAVVVDPTCKTEAWGAVRPQTDTAVAARRAGRALAAATIVIAKPAASSTR